MNSRSLEVQIGTINETEERIFRIASQQTLAANENFGSITTLYNPFSAVEEFGYDNTYEVTVSNIYLQKHCVEFVDCHFPETHEEFSPVVQIMVADECLYEENDIIDCVASFPLRCKVVSAAPYIGRSFEAEDIIPAKVVGLSFNEAEDILTKVSRKVFIHNAIFRFDNVLDGICVHHANCDVVKAELPSIVNTTELLCSIVELYDELLEAYANRFGMYVYCKIHEQLDMLLIKYKIITGLEFDLNNLDFLSSVCRKFAPNNQGYLVGIEPNPGPNSSFIIACLKNAENQELVCASRPKRTNSKGSYLQRQLEKKKTIKKKNKRADFSPEGVFDVGIDDESKQFIASSIATLKELMSGGTEVRIDIVNPILSHLKELVEVAQVKFGFLYDYLKFVFAIVYRFSKDAGKKLLGEFSSLFFSFEPEGVIDNAFLLVLYKDTIGKYLGSYDIIGISRVLAKLSDERKLLKNSFNWIFELLKDITTSINTWFNTSIPILSGDSKLDQYFKHFYEVKKKFDVPGASHYHIAQELYILYESVERYYRDTTDRDDKEKVMYLLRLLKPLVQYCESSVNPNNGPRIEPLAICITGPSGVGKSSFTTPILLALLARVLPKDRLSEFMTNHNEFLFFRANENEYWDGYRSSHEAIVFDDFAQKRDVAGGDNADAFEIIRLKNTAPYHLHFASIADKQKNYANPRFLYCTTNRNTLKFNSIVCNEAVTRRFDMAVVQVPRLEYCIDETVTNVWERRLDMKKVRKQFPYSSDDPSSFLALDIVEFIDWDFTTGWPKDGGNTYNFHEFIKACEKIYLDLNNKGDAMLKYHQYIKSQYSAEGGDSDDEFFDCETLDESLKTLFDQVVTPQKVFPDNWKIFASIFGFVAGCFTGTALLKNAFSSIFESDGKTNHNSKLALKAPRRGRRSPQAALGKTKIARQYKGEAKNSDFDLLVKIVRRNLYTLYVTDRRVGNVVFLRGRTCVFPNHYNELVESLIGEIGESTATLYDCLGVPQFKFDWMSELNVYNFDFDLQALTIPGIREHADISECFVSESAISDGQGFEAMLPIFRNDQLVVLEPYVRIGYSTTYMGDYTSNKLQYIAATQSGDCGSPLITVDKRFSRPTILGFHTAGQTFSVGRKACLGVYLSREEVQYCLDALDEDLILKEDFECSLGFNMEGFSTLGKAKPPKFATKTKIEPTRIHGKAFDVTTKPAMLHPFVNVDGERVDPVHKAQFKYCTEPVCIDANILDQAAQIVNQRVLKNNVPAPWEPRLWTFQEAVAGVDGVDYCNAIDRSTSAGYPHNLEMKNGKKVWLGAEGKIDFDSEDIQPLRNLVFEVVSKAKEGIRCQHIYMDCLKDERRPIAKVEQGKTRQFMACPIQLLVAVRMYFGDFIRHVCSNKILNGISVGINPVSDEWTAMHNYLHPNESYVHGAGDYASFDCNLAPQVDYKFLECAELFYAPTSTHEDTIVRRVLFLDIVNSIHIDRKGNLYEFNGKNPSGQPATAVMNSYVNSIMLVSCWLKNGISASDIATKFFWNTFGDDHVTGFPKEFADKAGSLALASTMGSMFNFEYTDEAKTGEIINTKPLSEIQYLKRGFRFNGFGFDAPLELSVLKETLNWQKTSTTNDDLQLRFDCWYVELARHGRKIFDEVSKPISRVIRSEYGYTSPYATYEIARKSDVLFGPNF